MTETLNVDGTDVRITQGGCAHFGVTLEVPVTAAPADRRTFAVEILSKVGGDTILHRSFAEAPTPLPDEGFACGEAWCAVDVRQIAGGHLVTVGYDFAL